MVNALTGLGEVALLIGSLGLPLVLLLAIVLTVIKRRRQARYRWDDEPI